MKKFTRMAAVAAAVVATLALAPPALAGTYKSGYVKCPVNNKLDYEVSVTFDKGSQKALATAVDWRVHQGVGLMPLPVKSVFVLAPSEAKQYVFGSVYYTGGFKTGFTHYDPRSVEIMVRLTGVSGQHLCYATVWSG